MDRRWVSLAGLILAVFHPAHASLLWLGASAGRAQIPSTSTETSVGAVLGADIPLVPFLNIEAGYQRLRDIDLQLVTGSALLRMPILPEVHLLARLGVAHVSGINGNPVAAHNDPLYGAGASVRLGSPLSLRFDYQVAHDRSLGNIKTTSGALIYHF